MEEDPGVICLKSKTQYFSQRQGNVSVVNASMIIKDIDEAIKEVPAEDPGNNGALEEPFNRMNFV